jgi:hypothetical protein
MLAAEYSQQKHGQLGGLILQSAYLSVKTIVKELMGPVSSLISNKWNNEEAIPVILS